MYLPYLSMLIHELLNKYLYIVPEEDPIVILDSNSGICMASNGEATKHTRHIFRRVNFVRNGEN